MVGKDEKEPAPQRGASARSRALLPILAFAVVSATVIYFVRQGPLPSPEQPLEVRKLIEAVRDELAAAEAARLQKGELPLFELKEFEMEINYLVRNSGGTQAEVVGVGTKLDATSERVQKLRLKWAAIPERLESIPQGVVFGPVKTVKPSKMETKQ